MPEEIKPVADDSLDEVAGGKKGDPIKNGDIGLGTDPGGSFVSSGKVPPATTGGTKTSG